MARKTTMTPEKLAHRLEIAFNRIYQLETPRYPSKHFKYYAILAIFTKNARDRKIPAAKHFSEALTPAASYRPSLFAIYEHYVHMPSNAPAPDRLTKLLSAIYEDYVFMPSNGHDADRLTRLLTFSAAMNYLKHNYSDILEIDATLGYLALSEEDRSEIIKLADTVDKRASKIERIFTTPDKPEQLSFL